MRIGSRWRCPARGGRGGVDPAAGGRAAFSAGRAGPVVTNLSTEQPGRGGGGALRRHRDPNTRWGGARRRRDAARGGGPSAAKGTAGSSIRRCISGGTPRSPSPACARRRRSIPGGLRALAAEFPPRGDAEGQDCACRRAGWRRSSRAGRLCSGARRPAGRPAVVAPGRVRARACLGDRAGGAGRWWRRRPRTRSASDHGTVARDAFETAVDRRRVREADTGRGGFATTVSGRDRATCAESSDTPAPGSACRSSSRGCGGWSTGATTPPESRWSTATASRRQGRREDRPAAER